HHLDHQCAGRQRHQGLEPFLALVGQPGRNAQQHQRQRAGQHQAGADAAPKPGQSAPAFGRGAQPGIQDADDQQGLDTFTPDDEADLFHDGQDPFVRARQFLGSTTRVPFTWGWKSSKKGYSPGLDRDSTTNEVTPGPSTFSLRSGRLSNSTASLLSLTRMILKRPAGTSRRAGSNVPSALKVSV